MILIAGGATMANERRLGASGLTTPPLILGGNVFGWTADRQASFAILDAFVAGGGRMIDTADSYSTWVPGHRGGESETIIGGWLRQRGRRDDVLIATKVGAEVAVAKGLAPARIAAAAEGSLQRLGTDHIDLYRRTATIRRCRSRRRWRRSAADPCRQGAGDRRLEPRRPAAAAGARHQRGARAGRYTVLQPDFNLIERARFEGPLLDLCVARGIAGVPYFALASGFLTGKYRRKRTPSGAARGGAVGRYLDAHGLAVLAAVDAVAADAGATPAQVALAWLAAQRSVAAPIASATSVAQVEELLGAMRLVLTLPQLAALDAASRVEA